MTFRVYTNRELPGVTESRSGEIGNGLKSNNRYFHNYGSTSGSLQPTQYNMDFAWPSQAVENRLYGALVEKVAGGSKAQLLTAAAEWKSSLQMVTERVLWIAESYKKFRRFDLPGTVRMLSRPVARPVSYHHVKNERGFTSWNRRARAKHETQNVTSGWLEYWMGWAPAMGDIHAALDVLQRPFPKQHISVATGYSESFDINMDFPGWSKGRETVMRRGSFGCYADMEITNYNLFLLNQMGLLNPVNTAFEIIPFSFVLNWFVNVQQVLGSLTDFAGVSLVNTGTAHLQTREGSRTVLILEWYERGDGSWETRWAPDNGTYHGFSKLRIPGELPTPRLVMKFDRLSLTRAATAVSLLVELFLRKRP